jgi:hypothetical protein
MGGVSSGALGEQALIPSMAGAAGGTALATHVLADGALEPSNVIGTMDPGLAFLASTAARGVKPHNSPNSRPNPITDDQKMLVPLRGSVLSVMNLLFYLARGR